MSRSLNEIIKNKSLKEPVDESKFLFSSYKSLSDPIYIQGDFGAYQNDEGEYFIDKNIPTPDPDMYVSKRLYLTCTEYQEAINEACKCYISYGNVLFKTEQDVRDGIDWVISLLPMARMRGLE